MSGVEEGQLLVADYILQSSTGFVGQAALLIQVSTIMILHITL
ncbi:hypothetical protein KDI_55640 [Dictyobacter arantiisoli]|uniref:Uncharacterized protein n=1 Tax=Dictyobacter arantiisoli TaxID=2014874 RepID=A0A5A5TK51_9CHLR|nr:hypothetical protein KDI_55640 [Dictyobacter arantiisoli]